MEKPHQEEYRDEIADRLREIRSSDSENPELAQAKAQGYLMAIQETEKYQKEEEYHRLSSVAERLTPIVESVIAGYLETDSAKQIFNGKEIESMHCEFSKDKKCIYLNLFGEDNIKVTDTHIFATNDRIASSLVKYLNENTESLQIPKEYNLFIKNNKSLASGHRIQRGTSEGGDVWEYVVVNP
ncbi:MAG: hypothetical protein FGM57_03100 [Candidatus Taylorbacteria bacterium]|nr:hypothetical protein [Candidatus Taylorbacteria bacterium]